MVLDPSPVYWPNLRPESPEKLTMAKKKQQEVQRQRRSTDQRIADLAAKIVALKEREARKQAKADPALRHAAAALKSVDKALAESKDAALRKALNETRSALGKCLGLEGGVIAPMRRSALAPSDLADALLTYVRSNPGQRGEQIAVALGTDTTTMRPVMKRLIADGMVATEGQRRGMTYAAV